MERKEPPESQIPFDPSVEPPPGKVHGISEWPLPPPEPLHEPMPEGWVPPPPPEPLPEPMPEDLAQKPGCAPNLVKAAVGLVLLIGVVVASVALTRLQDDDKGDEVPSTAAAVAPPASTTSSSVDAAAPAAVPAAAASIDGTYAITSTVTESSVGSGVSCTNDPNEWTVTTVPNGSTRTANVVTSAGQSFALPLDADNRFELSVPVSGGGATGTST